MATKATKEVVEPIVEEEGAFFQSIPDAVANLRNALKNNESAPFASQIDTCLRQIEAYLTAR